MPEVVKVLCLNQASTSLFKKEIFCFEKFSTCCVSACVWPAWLPCCRFLLGCEYFLL